MVSAYYGWELSWVNKLVYDHPEDFLSAEFIEFIIQEVSSHVAARSGIWDNKDGNFRELVKDMVEW